MTRTLGIIGGTGWLGGALIRPALADGFVSPESLWLSSRKGAVSGFEVWPGIRITTDNAALVADSDCIILSVRPEDLPVLDLDLSGKLVISVMARVNAAAITRQFGATRIIRSMPNASAEQRLSFTPIFCSDAVTDDDRRFATGFFACSGQVTEVEREERLDYYTALTGSGPAFIAAFADAMIRDAMANGIGAAEADAAVRQLFLGASTLIAASSDR